MKKQKKEIKDENSVCFLVTLTEKAIGEYENPSLKVCLSAVQSHGLALKHIKKELRTEQICLEAVKENGWALEFVKNQTEEICMEAVKNNPYALEYAKIQTPEMCLHAVNQYGEICQFVKIVDSPDYETCVLNLNALIEKKNLKEKIAFI